MKKQSLLVISVIAFLLTLTIGYATFSDTITINGTSNAKGNFDVEFSSITIGSEVGSTNTSAEISEDRNTLTITVPKLEYPGAYSEIVVNVTNKGTIPAKLTTIEENGLNNNENIVVSYSGLHELKENVINQNETQTFNIKIMWDLNSTTSSKNVVFSIKLKYEQVTI